MWKLSANSNNKKNIRVNSRIFSLSFPSEKVIKAVICFDRNSLATFFQFFTDISIDCHRYKDTHAIDCAGNIVKYVNKAKR